MDKNVKQKQAEKKLAEEAALNRILNWVVGGAVLEFLLLLLDRYYSHYTVAQIPIAVALRTVVKVVAVVALVGCLVCAFLWRRAAKAEKKTAWPAMGTLFLGGVAVSCFATWVLYGIGLQVMTVVVPVVVVLVIIFYLYQHEFFLIACQSAVALLGIWVCGVGVGSNYARLAYLYVALAALLLLASAALCRLAQTGQGKVTLRGRKLRVFPRDANYAALYAGTVILLGVLVLAALGVSSVVLYSVAVAWLLVMAVYYTVKLM